MFKPPTGQGGPEMDPIHKQPLPSSPGPVGAEHAPLPVGASPAMASPPTMQQHTFATPPPVCHQEPSGQAPPPHSLPSNNQHGPNNRWVKPLSPHGVPVNYPYGPGNRWAGPHDPGPYGPPARAQTQPQVLSYGGSHLVTAQLYQAHQPPVIQYQGQNHGGWSQQASKGTGTCAQTVVVKQPSPDKAMKYAAMTEEERANQERRDQQAAATKQCLGKTCIACGKVCKATAVMCSAMVCVLGCLMRCIPGDSPGFSGGGAGISVSMPT